jgi:hypothetical protein
MNDDTMVFRIVLEAIKEALGGRPANDAAAHAADQIDALTADMIVQLSQDQPTH